MKVFPASRTTRHLLRRFRRSFLEIPTRPLSVALPQFDLFALRRAGSRPLFGRCSFSSGSRSRKEVFQPHLPVRLPCYDLAPVTCLTLGRSLRSRASGTPGSHGLTGGVYKARERIHRAMADARLLANPASRSRVADSDPNWEQVSRFPQRRRFVPCCPAHCNTCVAPDVRAVLI